MKIKASINKYIRDYEKRNNIAEDSTNSSTRNNPSQSNNSRNGQTYLNAKGKDPSKKSIKPLIMKLDFNNKIETTKKSQS